MKEFSYPAAWFEKNKSLVLRASRLDKGNRISSPTSTSCVGSRVIRTLIVPKVFLHQVTPSLESSLIHNWVPRTERTSACRPASSD